MKRVPYGASTLPGAVGLHWGLTDGSEYAAAHHTVGSSRCRGDLSGFGAQLPFFKHFPHLSIHTPLHVEIAAHV